MKGAVTYGCRLCYLRLQSVLPTVAGEISHLAEPLTPQKLSFHALPEPLSHNSTPEHIDRWPGHTWPAPPGTPPSDEPPDGPPDGAPAGARDGAPDGARAELPPQSMDTKLQTLQHRCDPLANP